MKNKTILILGDILAIAIVTIIGFVTHDEGSLEYLPRMAAAFFPLVIAWLLLAPWFGLFGSQTVIDSRTLWRPAFAVLFAAPLALVLRGLILNTSILPVFAIVFSATSAFGLSVWRAIYLLFARREHK